VTLELDADIQEAWIAWRLVCEGKATVTDLDHLTISRCDQAGRALDAWHAAETQQRERDAAEARKRNESRRRGR
jgi:hypothetical protein